MKRLNNFFSAIWAFIKKYKIVFIVALVVLLFVFGLIRDNTKRKKTNSNNNSVNQIVSGEDKVVKISGGVNKDYYGYIKEDKYLFEIIIEYCNGLNDYACIDNLELDKIISSTTEIIIQEDNEKKNNEIKIIDVSTKTNTIYRYAGRKDGIITIYKVNEDISEEDFKLISKTDTKPKYININTCKVEDLLTLDKITKTKAQAIIEYREKNGKFNSIEEIMNVSGIGEATFLSIKDFICVK